MHSIVKDLFEFKVQIGYFLKHESALSSYVPDLHLTELNIFQFRLLYTHATILEIQRLSYTVPGSVPRYAEEDIEVTSGGQKCTIPRGANVLCNLKKFFLDPDTFKEPTKFSPERFLTSDGAMIKKYEEVQ